MKASVGRLVHVVVDPRQNNGEDVAAALITKVHESDGDEQRVNLRVFLDTGADLRWSNVPLVSSRPNEDDEEGVDKSANSRRVAFTPPRV